MFIEQYALIPSVWGIPEGNESLCISPSGMTQSLADMLIL